MTRMHHSKVVGEGVGLEVGARGVLWGWFPINTDVTGMLCQRRVL